MDSDLHLSGRRVIVTGAASGIGLATVRALAAAGAKLAIIDWDREALDEIVRELREAGHEPLDYQIDVADERTIEETFASIAEAWSGVDTLIHVAGIMREQMTDIRDIELSSWQKVISVNLTGAFLVTRAVSRTMIPQGAGTIILIGSPAGVTAGSGSIPYGASKGGVNGLALTMQRHLQPHGIRVHNFCPGSVNTPLYNNSLSEGERNGASTAITEAARAASVSSDGVGQAIALLASPLAEYLQGSIFSR